MSPSTHSADVSQIQTDTAAILVDTGTSIPATIATVDTNVDAVLVDTGTTLPASISALRDNATGFAGGDINASNNSSASYADSGMSITTPNVAGKTYTVVLYRPGYQIADVDTVIVFRYTSPSKGDGTGYRVGPATVAWQSAFGGLNAEAGFAANELVKIQWQSQVNTKYVYLHGPWAMMAYEEP